MPLFRPIIIGRSANGVTSIHRVAAVWKSALFRTLVMAIVVWGVSQFWGYVGRSVVPRMRCDRRWFSARSCRAMFQFNNAGYCESDGLLQLPVFAPCERADSIFHEPAARLLEIKSWSWWLSLAVVFSSSVILCRASFLAQAAIILLIFLLRAAVVILKSKPFFCTPQFHTDGYGLRIIIHIAAHLLTRIIAGASITNEVRNGALYFPYFFQHNIIQYWITQRHSI